MRSKEETVMQPAPSELSLEEIKEELVINLGMPQEVAQKLTVALAKEYEVNDVSKLKQLASNKMLNLCFREELTKVHLHMVRILLGTAVEPFEFLEVKEEHDNDKGDKKTRKGGAQQIVAGMLLERRAPLQKYFPPEEFDLHQAGKTTRNEAVLRKLVVKELYDMCGDLYADQDERKIILGGITAHVGPPLLRGKCPGHWDNWKDTDLIGHKGTAIADLEKARRDPIAYGVKPDVVIGQRPARPHRGVQQKTSMPEGQLGSGQTTLSIHMVPGASNLPPPGATPTTSLDGCT